MNNIKSLLAKNIYSVDELIRLLNANNKEIELIFRKAFEIKERYCGNKVWLRALIEFSNKCRKNCYYCGIRKSNKKVIRYEMSLNEILNLIESAYDENYKSIVLQSGENINENFINKILLILKFSDRITKNGTGITLSCGEQKWETYKKWFDNGAERYLIRIETSNKELFNKIHPNNNLHCFDERINALKAIKEIGYQTGTGVMIGLPFQTDEDLAKDLLFMQELDIDMCGMGPYIENYNTPLYKYFKNLLFPIDFRVRKTFLMIALLRIMMKDINIASSTALYSANKGNIVKAISCGANVIMPNLTPLKYQNNYILYKEKKSINYDDYDFNKLKRDLLSIDHIIDNKTVGNSVHYTDRINSE